MGVPSSRILKVVLSIGLAQNSAIGVRGRSSTRQVQDCSKTTAVYMCIVIFDCMYFFQASAFAVRNF